MACMLLCFYAFYAHPAANQNQSMRVSVSVSAGGGREGSLVCWGPEFDQTWRFSSFSSFRMLRLVLFSTVFLCLVVPAPAPFAKSDPRSIFNFLIEPWWCLVPKIVRCQIMRIRRWMRIIAISHHQWQKWRHYVQGCCPVIQIWLNQWQSEKFLCGKCPKLSDIFLWRDSLTFRVHIGGTS